jgi:hypothetical protein
MAVPVFAESEPGPESVQVMGAAGPVSVAMKGIAGAPTLATAPLGEIFRVGGTTLMVAEAVSVPVVAERTAVAVMVAVPPEPDVGGV